MKNYYHKKSEKKIIPASDSLKSDKKDTGQFARVVDNRPINKNRIAFQFMADNSDRILQFKSLQSLADNRVNHKRPVQFSSVIQLQKDSTIFGASVYGNDEIIDVFDQLMANNELRQEVQNDHLRDNRFLELVFFATHSRFTGRRIYINENYRGNTAKIRQDLAFELHNATSTGTKSNLMQASNIPDNNKSNIQKIKAARITEYTEWLNILKLGIKYEDPASNNMGFTSEPNLIASFKSHYFSFDEYLKYQLMKGHTQLYLTDVNSEKQANQALDLNNKDPEYYRRNIPELFVVRANEPETLEAVVQNLGGNSDMKKAVEKGKTLDSRKAYIQQTLTELYNVFRGTEKENIANSIIDRFARISKTADLTNKSVFINLNIQLLSLRHDLSDKVQEKIDKENEIGILSGIFRGLI